MAKEKTTIRLTADDRTKLDQLQQSHGLPSHAATIRFLIRNARTKDVRQ